MRSVSAESLFVHGDRSVRRQPLEPSDVFVARELLLGTSPKVVGHLTHQNAHRAVV